MKSLLIFLVLLSINIYSQNGWQVQLGGVDPYNYNRDIFFLNSQTGWILQSNNLKFTSNAGQNWSEKDFSIQSYNYSRKIFFIDINNGWVAGAKILRTLNGGTSWQVLDSITNPLSLYFLNNLTGWICGYGGLLKKTTNGGINWLADNIGITENINSVYFMNEQTGFLAADWGKIFRTANGGVNWEIYYDDINYSFMQSIKFIDQQTGFVCATGGNIFKTTNTGINWQKITTANFSAFKDISFADPNNGYAMGNGEIFRTTNGGNNWFQTASSGLIANTFGIEAFSSGNIWVIADSSVIYKSTDNAQTWNEKFRQFLITGGLLSIKFLNNQTGISCGEKGRIIKTTNGGNNWSIINSGTSRDLYSLFFQNQYTGFAAGGTMYLNNVILRTTNSGDNWSVILNDTSGCLFNIYFLNNITGWAAGYRGLLKTTNGGFNWYRLTPYPQVLAVRDVKFINENTGYAVRYSSPGGYYMTTNAGLNWIYIASVSMSNMAIDFVNINTGFILGNATNNSVLLKSTDGGANWNSYLLGQLYYYGMCFTDVNTGWAVGGGYSYPNIKITTNGGINWFAQTVNISASLASVNFINNNEGWACGNYGTIIHTTDGGSIGINNISTEVPIDYKLFQNYPNPFNPLTKIKFDVLEKSFVNLEIYNSIGQLIEQLVNYELDRGSYEIEWNAGSFASGVYFYVLKAGDGYYNSKKMVLIK